MTIVENAPPKASGGLIGRVKNILMTPKAEWAVIDGEAASIPGLFAGYICILAAIPVIARLINGLVFGHGIPGVFTITPSPIFLIVSAVFSYVMSLVGVAVIALIIDALAPSFGGTKNRIQAFKVAAYSYTAAWVFGIFGIIPFLGIIGGLLGLYSFYLLYLGLPRLMKSPDDKALGYTAVTVILAVVVYIVIGMVVGAVMAASMGMAAFGTMHTAAVGPSSVTIGGTRVDLGQMQAAANNMQAAAGQMKNATGANGSVTVNGSGTPAVAGDVLKGFLPGALGGGFARSEISTSSGGVAGFNASTAEARYTRGDSSITLTVTDMAAAGALANLGGALGVTSSRETATGYDKVGVVDGRMTTEEYDRQNHSGKYGVMFGKRFMVEAEGSQVSMDDLKNAVGATNPSRLESLAR